MIESTAAKTIAADGTYTLQFYFVEPKTENEQVDTEFIEGLSESCLNNLLLHWEMSFTFTSNDSMMNFIAEQRKKLQPLEDEKAAIMAKNGELRKLNGKILEIMKKKPVISFVHNGDLDKEVGIL